MHHAKLILTALSLTLATAPLAWAAPAPKVEALRSQLARGYSPRAMRSFDRTIRLGSKPLTRGTTAVETHRFENGNELHISRRLPNTLRSGHLNYQQVGGLQQLSASFDRPGKNGASYRQSTLVELDGKQFRSRVEVSKARGGLVTGRRSYEHHESGGKNLRVVSEAITVQRGDKTTVELNRSSLVLFGKLRLPLGRMYPGLPRKGVVKK